VLTAPKPMAPPPPHRQQRRPRRHTTILQVPRQTVRWPHPTQALRQRATFSRRCLPPRPTPLPSDR
jgi:hypothetical protein